MWIQPQKLEKRRFDLKNMWFKPVKCLKELGFGRTSLWELGFDLHDELNCNKWKTNGFYRQNNYLTQEVYLADRDVVNNSMWTWSAKSGFTKKKSKSGWHTNTWVEMDKKTNELGSTRHGHTNQHSLKNQDFGNQSLFLGTVGTGPYGLSPSTWASPVEFPIWLRLGMDQCGTKGATKLVTFTAGNRVSPKWAHFIATKMA